MDCVETIEKTRRGGKLPGVEENEARIFANFNGEGGLAARPPPLIWYGAGSGRN